MREPSFDELDQMLSEMNPGDDLLETMVEQVTPWKKNTNRIVCGLALTTIKLNFLLLDYLLPTIGMVLLVLGFRGLRRENGAFRLCYGLSMVQLGMQAAVLLLNCTIWNQRIYTEFFPHLINCAALGLLAVMIAGLWQGLRQVRRKAGQEPKATCALQMLLWYGGLIALGLAGYHGLFAGLCMVVLYVLMLRSLSRFCAELDAAGYVMEPAPVRLSDQTVTVGIMAALAAGMSLCFVLFHSYPMEWTTVGDTAPTAQVQAAADHLRALGFPEDVLADLTEEDILSCKDAVRLVTDHHEHPFNDGREVVESCGNYTQHSTVYDVKELLITNVGVELPGEREQWKLFHHFRWQVDPGFRGTESIQFWPAYRNDHEQVGWELHGDFTGQLLYDLDGTTCRADYYRLDSTSYEASDLFGNSSTVTDVFAEFSLPKHGENKRGYVSYAIEEIQDGMIVDSWMNYTHQTDWFQYPVCTARERRMRGGFDLDGTFRTVQDALQFYPNDEVLETFSQRHS